MVVKAEYKLGDYTIHVTRYPFQDKKCDLCGYQICNSHITNDGIVYTFLCCDCIIKYNLGSENWGKRKQGFALLKLKGNLK